MDYGDVAASTGDQNPVVFISNTKPEGVEGFDRRTAVNEGSVRRSSRSRFADRSGPAPAPSTGPAVSKARLPRRKCQVTIPTSAGPQTGRPATSAPTVKKVPIDLAVTLVQSTGVLLTGIVARGINRRGRGEEGTGRIELASGRRVGAHIDR